VEIYGNEAGMSEQLIESLEKDARYGKTRDSDEMLLSNREDNRLSNPNPHPDNQNPMTNFGGKPTKAISDAQSSSDDEEAIPSGNLVSTSKIL